MESRLIGFVVKSVNVQHCFPVCQLSWTGHTRFGWYLYESTSDVSHPQTPLRSMPDFHDQGSTCRHAAPLRRSVRIAAMIGIPLLIGFALSVLVAFAQWLKEDAARFFIIGLDGMRMQLAVVAASIILCVTTVFFLRPGRQFLLIIGGVALILIGLFYSLIRLDGFNGDRTPRFAWRWTPRSEEKFTSYLVAKVDNSKLDIDRDWTTPLRHDFPGFMGRDRSASVSTVRLDDDWESKAPAQLWRHPVGLGWSSFAIVGQIAVNLEQRDQDECVVGYHARTGEELWCHTERTRFLNEHGDGPRSTPTISGGRVYAVGGTGVLTCVELGSGSVVWKQNLFSSPEQQNLYFGTTSSPYVIQDLVIVTPGSGPNGSAMAFHRETGELQWSSGNDPAAYASPTVATVDGIPQVLSFNGAGLRTYSLDGHPLLLHPWVTQGTSRVNVAQPIVLDRETQFQSGAEGTLVLISSGYDMGTCLLRIRQVDGAWESEEIWRSAQLKSKLSNFVVHDEHIYGLDNGLMTCLRLDNGVRTWKKGRYGHGQLLLVGDRILIQAESGEIALVEANPTEHRELGRFVGLSSKTWNHPSLAGNLLIIRNDSEAAAFELPVQ